MAVDFDTLIEDVGAIARSGVDRDKALKAVCELLAARVDHYDWVGFYLAEPGTRTLVLGPFSGEPTEHTRIGYGQGICGQAAETLETFVVQDVSEESNYLSCSPVVKSEIVVPIFKNGEFVGELDIDSHTTAPFTEADKAGLERICGLVSDIM